MAANATNILLLYLLSISSLLLAWGSSWSDQWKSVLVTVLPIISLNHYFHENVTILAVPQWNSFISSITAQESRFFEPIWRSTDDIWYEWNQCRSLYVDLCVRLHITAQSFDSIRARPRWHFSEENEFLCFYFFSHFCNTNKSLSILGLPKPGKGTRPRIRNERTFSEGESRTWDRFKRGLLYLLISLRVGLGKQRGSEIRTLLPFAFLSLSVLNPAFSLHCTHESVFSASDLSQLLRSSLLRYYGMESLLLGAVATRSHEEVNVDGTFCSLWKTVWKFRIVFQASTQNSDRFWS